MQWESVMYTYGSARQPPELELEHYGIRGQRWGTRRFQNPDGTLTAEGKVRYGENDGSSEKTGGTKKSNTGEMNKSDRSNWKVKDVKDLSDEELKKRNNRLQAEQNYKNNMTPQWKKDAKQFNKNAVQEAVKNIFIGTAVTALAAVMAKNYKKAGPVIANASKIAVSKIRTAVKTNTRKAINNAVNKYSSSKYSAARYKADREYDYRLGNRNGIRKSHEWPTLPAKDKKKKG